MWIKYNNDWNDFFREEFSKEYFKNLIDKVNKEYQINNLCPKKEDIFKVFELCSFSNLKIIFLGQDPYHTPNVANGLSFSVNNELNYTPPSLKNIFKELYSDLKIKRVDTNLEDWVKQGVFLINTVLTVYENKPLSCSNWGWDKFILDFINYLNKSKSRYIYVLLGNNAKSYIKYINLKKDIIIQSSHPSPLSYKKGFENSKIFSKINNELKKINKDEIKW